MKNYKKMMAMSKSELEDALKELQGTKSTYPDGDTFAMCYSIMPMTRITKSLTFKCSKCMEYDQMTFYTYNEDENIITNYKQLAKEYTKLGYDAKIQHFCDSCIDESNGKLSTLMFLFKTKGMNDYTYTELDTDSYSDDEYQIVLKFLQGRFSYDELNKTLRYAYSSNELNDIIERITGIKLPIGQSND
jgi:hypothetical protein